MGLLEPDVRHGGGDGEPGLKLLRRRAVTVHSLSHVRAAVEAAAALGVPVTVLSAPAAAAAGGPGWFRAMVETACAETKAAMVTAVLDCGDLPGHALAALRHGITAIRYDGPAADRIADIAGQTGAVVLAERPPALDLREVEAAGRNLDAACRAWLAAHD